MSSEKSFPTGVSGTVTRLYPGVGRCYFRVSGDKSLPGASENDYNFILYTAQNFQATYQLLLKAAERGWTVQVRRSDSITQHQFNEKSTYYHIDYVYVNF